MRPPVLLQPHLTDSGGVASVVCSQGGRSSIDRGQAARRRSSPAIAYRKGKGNFLFDCGEDTQRQLLRQALVRPGKIDRIFITRRSAETCFGLPGWSQPLSRPVNAVA